MSGIGMVLNTAKEALAAQQLGLNVTGHNIANVNTPSYSRQNVPHASKGSVNIRGYNLGMGVDAQQVMRTSDQMLETRLIGEKSNLAAFEEADAFMNVMESLFNENSDSSLSTLMSDFWNTWHDLSNNPMGSAERSAVLDKGAQMTERFDTLNAGLMDLERDLTIQTEAAISNVNTIAAEIAKINSDIVGQEASGPANDHRDKRNALLTELSELVDTYSFEQPDGALTVTTAQGHILVNGTDSFPLEMSEGRVMWEGSNGSTVDITDKISSGKIGGWLEIRDEVVSKYKTELDVIARELIWSVNQVHSQGVGLDYFTAPLTGTYATDASGQLATLPYGDRIDYTEDFKMWIKDGSTAPPDFSSVDIAMGLSETSVTNWAGAASDPGPPNSPPYKFVFTVTTAGMVGPGTDDPVISWEKFKSDGTSTGISGTTTINDVNTLSSPVDGLTFDVSAGRLVAGNTFTINTDNTGAADTFDFALKSDKANSILDTYTFTVTSAEGDGKIQQDTVEIEWSNSITSGSIILDGSDPYPQTVEVDGMQLQFRSGTVFTGDVFTVTTDQDGLPTAQSSSEWHWTLASFKDQFNAQASGVSAEVTSDNTLRFRPLADNYSFAFSDNGSEDSGLGAALGINSFLVGQDAMTIGVNSVLADVNKIAAARIDTADHPPLTSDHAVTTFPVDISPPNNIIIFEEDDGSGLRGPFTATLTGGSYNTEADLNSLAADIESALEAASTVLDYEVRYDAENKKFVIQGEGSSPLKELRIQWTAANSAGPMLGFSEDDVYLSPTGDYGLGDNSNALAMTDLQSAIKDFSQWAFERGQDVSSGAVSATLEGYYQQMVGSIGTKALSISRSRDFSEVMVDKIGEQRDSLSGVSLDEEMVNLMKYQHAYSVASKLLQVSDEMLATLIAAK